jgi:hypothetical protein
LLGSLVGAETVFSVSCVSVVRTFAPDDVRHRHHAHQSMLLVDDEDPS